MSDSEDKKLDTDTESEQEPAAQESGASEDDTSKQEASPADTEAKKSSPAANSATEPTKNLDNPASLAAINKNSKLQLYGLIGLSAFSVLTFFILLMMILVIPNSRHQPILTKFAKVDKELQAINKELHGLSEHVHALPKTDELFKKMDLVETDIKKLEQEIIANEQEYKKFTDNILEFKKRIETNKDTILLAAKTVKMDKNNLLKSNGSITQKAQNIVTAGIAHYFCPPNLEVKQQFANKHWKSPNGLMWAVEYAHTEVNPQDKLQLDQAINLGNRLLCYYKLTEAAQASWITVTFLPKANELIHEFGKDWHDCEEEGCVQCKKSDKNLCGFNIQKL